MNSPFFSVAMDLSKNNIDDSKRAGTGVGGASELLCIEHYDAEEAVEFEDCETITATDLTFSFVLTSILKEDAGSWDTPPPPPPASSVPSANGAVPLSRGHYSSAVLESLQAVFPEQQQGEEGERSATAPFAALLNQIHHSPSYSGPAADAGGAGVAGERENGQEEEAGVNGLVTAKKTPVLCVSAESCGGGGRPLGANTGYALTYHRHDRNVSSSAESSSGRRRRRGEDGEEHYMEISKRVIDSKYVPSIPAVTTPLLFSLRVY